MRLVSVVLPCRDEGENVPRVVAAVRSALREAGVDHEFVMGFLLLGLWLGAAS